MDISHIKVGILIPAYNIEKDIFRALDSCVAQTYKNLEIIVVDDGSEDQTYEVIKQYSQKDKRIKVFRQENSGVSSARNHALAMTNADYVVFLDSDDWLDNNAIEKYIQKLGEYKEKNALLASGRYYIEAGSFSRSQPDSDVEEIILTSEEALLYVGQKKYNLRNAGYKLYSTDVIQRYGLHFDSEIRHGEDGLFVFEYLKVVDKFIYFPEPLWNVFRRPGSACRSPYNSAMLSAVSSVEKMLAYNNSEILRRNLESYFVQRILGILSAAFLVYPNSKNDIVFLRQKLKPMFRRYMVIQTDFRQKMIYLFGLCTPCFIARKVYTARKNGKISR